VAITQAMCTSFKVDLFGGVQDLDTDTIKMALYTSSATLDASTTAYTTSNEVSSSGTNYTAGGNTLTSPVITSSGTTAYVDFADTTWSNASFTARGALIYNASKSNKAIAVLDFGADKTATAGDFVVQMPTADASNALIRIA
jgi:hypothetical protein